MIGWLWTVWFRSSDNCFSKNSWGVAVQSGTRAILCFSLKPLGLFSLLLGFSTAAGRRCHLLLQVFLSPQIATGAVQPRPGHMKCVCPSQFGGGSFLDAARDAGSCRTSRESRWLAAPGMQSPRRTHPGLQANSLSDGTGNFHLNSAGILHWKQPVN